MIAQRETIRTESNIGVANELQQPGYMRWAPGLTAESNYMNFNQFGIR